MTDAHIQHVNITVDDLAAADSFYGEFLGLARLGAPEMGFPAEFYRINETQELHVNELSDARPERGHFCLCVPDFSAVFARARELGVLDTDVFGKVRRLPTGAMQAFVRDPSGNLVELSCEPDHPVDPAIFELDIVESAEGFYEHSP